MVIPGGIEAADRHWSHGLARMTSGGAGGASTRKLPSRRPLHPLERGGVAVAGAGDRLDRAAGHLGPHAERDQVGGGLKTARRVGVGYRILDDQGHYAVEFAGLVVPPDAGGISFSQTSRVVASVSSTDAPRRNFRSGVLASQSWIRTAETSR